MGLCVSMLQTVAKIRQPEPRRGTPKPLFIVRSIGRRPPPPKPEAAPVFQAQSFGQSQSQKPCSRADIRGHERFRYEVPGVLDRRRCAPKLTRLPCRSTSAAAVEPVAVDERSLAPTMAHRGAPPEARRKPVAAEESSPTTTTVGRGTPQEGSRTPAAAPMTPMRPVWQRRILMGMRCELPRFSGLILYDEHGRQIRGSTPGRSHPQWRKRTAKTSATLKDLL